MPIITTTKQLRPRTAHDFYPTPIELCYSALRLINTHPYRVYDPGAGDGVWGDAARILWDDTFIEGCDLRNIPQPTAYDHWTNQCDYLKTDFRFPFDVIMGNPPYRYAEQFIRQSLRFVRPSGANGGYIIFLLRLAFLESQTRGRGLWLEHPPKSIHVLVSRPSFTGNGKTDATAYAIYIWQKGWTGITELKWLDWENNQQQML